jgi:hypothetical protein
MTVLIIDDTINEVLDDTINEVLVSIQLIDFPL